MKKESGVRSQESGVAAFIPAGAGASATTSSNEGLASSAPAPLSLPADDPGNNVSPVAVGGTVGGRGSGRQEVCADVTKLASEWRELVEKLIEEGSTLEDVAEILQERQGPRVTLHALGVYYQSNLDLQKRRIKHLIELADKLKHAMAHPESTEGRLADATLLTGLVRLTRRHAQLTIKDAQSLRMQRENLRLRQRILKMKQAQAVREKSIAHQHYLYEEERRQKLKLENKKLEEILKKLRQDQTLPADVMEKIQEIYGIVKQPYIPPQLAERLPQDETPYVKQQTPSVQFFHS